MKTQIAAKLSRDQKTKEFDEWLKGLREEAKITVDEKALESVEVAAAQPRWAARWAAPGQMGGRPARCRCARPPGGARRPAPAPAPAPRQ